MQNLLIKDVMTPMVIWINERDSLNAAAKKMADCNVGSLPAVNDNGDLVGILTDRDIVLRACAKNLNLANTHVNQIMSVNVETCSPNSDVEEVTMRMADRRVRRMPVVEAGRLVGFCSLADLAISLRDRPNLVENTLRRISAPAKPFCEAA